MLRKTSNPKGSTAMTARPAVENGTARTPEIDQPKLQHLPGGDRTAGHPLLRLAAISKKFSNETVALEGVDLTVWPGEFVTLLGPSGCGKSTLLRLIGGLTSPSNGRLDWPRSDYEGSIKPNRSLGFVFQEPTLLPWRNVVDNVYLPMQLAGKRKSEVHERVMDVLAQVGLGHFADAYPRELSGGMRMRVSIARALLINPRIL
jgi:NitT/TauT family transport system ATP-binding protein